MTRTQELGRFAEDTAAKYLVSIGWRIIARNVRNKYGELDIVALDANTRPIELVIVEVRGRTIGKLQAPLDTIGSRKLRTLLRASQEYIDNDLEWTSFWRIDVIGITVKDKYTFEISDFEHVKNITG